MQFWAFIVDGVRHSLDRKIFWVLIVMSAFIALAMVSVGFEGGQISFFFGMTSIDSDWYDVSTPAGQSRVVGIVVYLLLSVFLGWIGVILMIVATADTFPAMMDKGAIDVVLAKPISRSRLFLYKYASAMVFVLFQATFFVVLTFLVMGLRWGVWKPGYLLSIPLLVLLFSYVYCVTVLVAVRTRSALTAILLSLVAWFLFAMPRTALDTFEAFPRFKDNKRLYETLKVTAWIPPKTADIPYLAANWAGAGTSMDMFPGEMMATGNPNEQAQLEQARQYEIEALKRSPLASIGSSLLFEVLIIGLALHSFRRRDF